MKKENNQSLRKLLKYSKKYLKYQKTPLILAPLLLLVSILSPFLIKYLIDDIIGNHEFSQILPFIILFTIVILSERLISFIVNYGYYKSTNLAARDEQIYMFKKILMIPIKEFSYNKIGDFMSRVLSDTLEVSFFLGAGISVITYNIIQLIVVSLVLLYLNWQLAVITFIMVPFYYFSLRAFEKNLQKSSELERIAYSDLTEELREKIEGLLPIKSFCKEKFFSKQYSKISWIWVKRKNRLNMLNQSAEDFMSFIYEMIPVLILGYGAYLILKGNATLGTLMGFYAYLGWIFTPIRNLSTFYIQMQRARQVSERIFEIHNFPEENLREGEPFPNNDYPITYENVYFKYKDNTVLHDINLTLGTKEKIAIVGTSGAGKSSFVNLIPRFYEPTTGKVMINGIDVKKYNLKQLRKNITIVRQDDYLFNMTVKENIMLDDEFSEEEFMKAVKKAKVDKFIGLLDEGYDTVVGERGSKLSDGQRQRVAIARALIREPKVLILDEATSGVDSQTEEEIFDELKEYEMTLIIISHRLSTIRKADKVILLKDGEIRGKGVHEELLKNSPIYKEIIESQLVV